MSRHVQQRFRISDNELAFTTIERTLKHFYADRPHNEFPLHISMVTPADRERYFGSA